MINSVVGGMRPKLMYSWSLLKQCSYNMSTELRPSMYILLMMYKSIIAMMTTGSDDGMKVSYGMLRDETYDKFSITLLPIMLPECHD
ncbi:hypothetical protein Tco_1120873 [Tanacetum coccineum]|uniref:Uncharacterized protein n=1 Tax=Tanacetum coccineum TaxID=301880 RepID=A0ABQ5IZ14_9ASTR